MSRNAHLAAAVAALLMATAAPPVASAASGAAIADAVSDGAVWIESQQAPDGTFNPGFSSFDLTATALAPASRNAADVANGGPSLQDALFTALSDPADPAHPTNAAAFENAILSGYAGGLDPARISAGENLAADLASTYAGGSFGDSSSFNNVAFGALALGRIKTPGFLRDRTVAVIRSNQHDDGGWNFGQSVTPDTRDDPSDVDLTGATMAALCDSGVPASDTAVQGGLTFLKSKFDPASGGFDSFGSSNSSTNSWAVSGLNACGIDPQGPGFNADQTPIDYLLSLQDNSGGADDGAFEFADPPNPFVPDGPNLPSSRDALRAVAGASFSAEPPARANPALPRRRAVPAVADGTPVPVAVAVDDGSGGVTFCRVTVPSGASLATLLATADASSTPAGCATGAEFTGGRLSKLNGQAGSWAFSVDRGAEQIAAGQAVRFGDVVALRRTGGVLPADPAPGGGGGTSPGPVPAALQAKTTPSSVASKALRASARKRVASVSLSCPRENRLCQGVVYLVYKKRTLARRAFLIGGGKTTKLNVKLSKGAMKRLGRSRKKVKVNVFSRDGAGIASTNSRTVTLTPTK